MSEHTEKCSGCGAEVEYDYQPGEFMITYCPNCGRSSREDLDEECLE